MEVFELEHGFSFPAVNVCVMVMSVLVASYKLGLLAFRQSLLFSK